MGRQTPEIVRTQSTANVYTPMPNRQIQEDNEQSREKRIEHRTRTDTENGAQDMTQKCPVCNTCNLLRASAGWIESLQMLRGNNRQLLCRRPRILAKHKRIMIASANSEKTKRRDGGCSFPLCLDWESLVRYMPTIRSRLQHPQPKCAVKE